MKTLFATLLLCTVASLAHAEKSQTFGDVTVHYNAITTDDLVPEVARAYKIERSKTRGLVTMAVLKKNKMGVDVPVSAKLSVYVTNITQQLAQVSMREIHEGTAVYYLGEFRVVPPDTLTFNGTVEIQGDPKRELKFNQQFFK
jgi:hypothetical protein